MEKPFSPTEATGRVGDEEEVRVKVSFSEGWDGLRDQLKMQIAK